MVSDGCVYTFYESKWSGFRVIALKVISDVTLTLKIKVKVIPLISI